MTREEFLSSPPAYTTSNQPLQIDDLNPRAENQWDERHASSDQFDTQAPTSDHHILRHQKHSGNTIGLSLKSFALNGSSTPFFWTGSNITGSVFLEIPTNSSENDRIKAITLELRCIRIVSASKGTSSDLGDSAFERPLLIIPVPLHGSQDDLGSVKDGSTHQSWNFSVDIPKTYSAVHKSKKNTIFPMPPTFSRSGFQEFTKYELKVRVKKGLLWSDEELLQQLIVLPHFTPPHLPSPYLLASYSHNLPLPLPSSTPSSVWASQSVSVAAQIDSRWEVETIIKAYIPTPVYYARGRVIPILLSLTINKLGSIASSSSTAGLGSPPSSVYAEVYETLRERIIVSLEAVYAMGSNASNGFHIDTPLHDLPHPSEIGAEVIVEHVRDSVPPWSAEAPQHQSQNGDSKDEDRGYVDEKDEGQRNGKYRKISQGKENWLQGEIIPNGNIMPDFIAPNLRLAHAVCLRIAPSPSLSISSITPPPSSKFQKMYNHYTGANANAGDPILSLPVIITTHSLKGDLTRSVAPVPDY